MLREIDPQALCHPFHKLVHSNVKNTNFAVQFVFDEANQMGAGYSIKFDSGLVTISLPLSALLCKRF